MHFLTQSSAWCHISCNIQLRKTLRGITVSFTQSSTWCDISCDIKFHEITQGYAWCNISCHIALRKAVHLLQHMQQHIWQHMCLYLHPWQLVMYIRKPVFWLNTESDSKTHKWLYIHKIKKILTNKHIYININCGLWRINSNKQLSLIKKYIENINLKTNKIKYH